MCWKGKQFIFVEYFSLYHWAIIACKEKFKSLIENKGVTYGKEEKRPVQFEYIDGDRRTESFEKIERDAVLDGQDRAERNNYIREAKRRNEDFIRKRSQRENDREADSAVHKRIRDDEGESGEIRTRPLLEKNNSFEYY